MRQSLSMVCESWISDAAATAKAILAFQPDGVVRRMLARERGAYTDNTKTDVDALLREFAEIRARGLPAEVGAGDYQASLTVSHGTADEFVFGVSLRSVPVPSFAVTALEGERQGPDKTWRAEVSLREGSQRYDILGYTREQVIADLLGQYERHMHYLHMHSGG